MADLPQEENNNLQIEQKVKRKLREGKEIIHSRVVYLSTTFVPLLGKYPRCLQQEEKLQIKTESDSNNYKARYE